MSSIELITAEDIRKYRKILKLTQKELAHKAGVSQSLIARIENKGIDPRLSTIKKIVDALAQNKEKRTAASVMNSPVITVDIKDSIRTTVDFMKKHNISQIPVLENNKIVGSIKETTILNHLMKKNDPDKAFSDLVYNVMEKRFMSVNLSTPLDDVIFFLSQNEPAVLVVDNSKLIGIITKIDILYSNINLKARSTN